MRLILFLCFCVLAANNYSSFSQTEYIEVKSSILKETREIKLQLPRNYHESDREYPVIIILDGDYLFEPFAGNVDYLSYWEIIPEAIVIGINQVGFRNEDGFIDPEDELPVRTGLDFFEFISLEVLKFADDNYRTAPFSVIAGMDYMANFSNFFLLKENLLFNGYISLSPDVSPKLPERLKIKLNKIDKKVWYYLATSNKDIPELKLKIQELNSTLSSFKNPYFNYTFQMFEDATHYSFVTDAIPQSLLAIFSGYSPISDSEFESKFLTARYPSNALEDKYLSIEKLYTIRVPVRIRDFFKTEEAIIQKELWEDYKNLSRIARKEAPNTVLHNYFEGRYYEKIGDPKRAIKEYQDAYGLKKAGYINSEYLLSKADELTRMFEN